jgi:hypothetical protein
MSHYYYFHHHPHHQHRHVQSSLFTFTLAVNSVLFWKLLVFKFLLGMSENFVCSVSAVLLTIILLDALQLLVLFVGTSVYLKVNLFLLITLYDLYCLIINC